MPEKPNEQQVDNEKLTFAEETPEKKGDPDKEPWVIMIVDDEEGVHAMTKRVLEGISFEGRPFSYLSVHSGKEARQLIRKNPDTALILLDVVMETDDAGLNFVRYIRKALNNNFVRIILLTGQPGQAPERKVITEYEINDYKLKSTLSDKGLLTAVISALRNFRDLMILEQNRRDLEDAMEESHHAHNARYQFLENMSHELRTPLNAIIGSSSRLASTE